MKLDRALILCAAFLLCAGLACAQQRKRIDRSVPAKEQRAQTKAPSSASSKTRKRTSTATAGRRSSYFGISSRSASFGPGGGTKTFTVSSSSPWRIKVSTLHWGHLSRNGNTLTLRIDKNTERSVRTGYFEISTGKRSIRVDISQDKGATLDVSSSSLNFAATGGSRTITVNSSGEWRIGTRTYDWGHLTVNGNTLTVMVDENTNTTQRTDYFTVKSGDMERRINITQQGKTAVLQPSRTATIKSVTVNNDADVDGKKGLSVKVSFNIKGMKGHDAKMSCYFHDSAGNALIDTNGAYCTSGKTPKVAVSREFKPLYENTVFTNLEVKIPYDELHLQGLYPRTLKVDVIIWDYTTSSPTEMARKYNTTFTCTPFPLVPYLKVDGMATDRTIKFEASGGRKRYSVSTDARTYETWGVPAWCSIVDKTASGFTLACNRNYSSLPRNDYMLVKASGKEVRINIKQDAKSGPTVAINKIWVDHNVFNGAVKGMNVHVKMDVSGMKGQTIKYYVRFYQENNLTQLIDGNGNPIYAYQTSVVKYENSTYNDWSIFIPNSNIFSAVNSNGRFSLDVEIRDNNGKLLAKKENYQFHTI